MNDDYTFQHPTDASAALLTRQQLASHLMRLPLITAINYTVEEVDRIAAADDPQREGKTKWLTIFYFFLNKEYEFTGPEAVLSLPDYQVGMHTAATNFEEIGEQQMARIALGNYHYHTGQACLANNSFTEADQLLSIATEHYKSAVPVYDPEELLIAEATHTSIRCILHMFQLNMDDLEFEARKGHKQYGKVADLVGDAQSPEYNAMMGVGQSLLVVSAFLKQIQDSNKFNFNAFHSDTNKVGKEASKAIDYLTRGVGVNNEVTYNLYIVKVYKLLAEVNHKICNGIYWLGEGRQVSLVFEELWAKIDNARELAKLTGGNSAMLTRFTDQIKDQVTNTKFRFKSELAPNKGAAQNHEKEKVIDLIGEDQLRSAMELILKMDDDGDLYTDVVQLIGRLTRVEDQYHRQTISVENHNLEMSKIAEAVLYQANKL